jgi:hypothetical protein
MKQPKAHRKIILISFAGVVFLIFVAAAGMGWKYHEQPQFCASCHLMKPYLQSWTGESKDDKGSTMMANRHGVKDIKCLDCHPSNIQQQVTELVTYIKGDYLDPLRTRHFPDTACTNCHNDEAKRLAESENFNISINPGGEFILKLGVRGNLSLLKEKETFNPHTVGVDENDPFDPHHGGAPRPECSNCHKSHQTSPEIDYCFSCHHSKTLLVCSDCHEKDDPGGLNSLSTSPAK